MTEHNHHHHNLVSMSMRKMRRTARSLVFLILFPVLQTCTFTFAWVHRPLPTISRKTVKTATGTATSTRRPSQWASSSFASATVTTSPRMAMTHKSEEHEPPQEKLDLKLLVLDHYDSFTYNLADMLAQSCTKPPVVLAADCARSWEDLQEIYDLYDLDGIILSPGPGNPVSSMTTQLSMDIVQKCPNVPILGVCLGHQILGHVYGATVDTAPVPIHGQVLPIRQLDLLVNTVSVNDKSKDDDDDLWKDIPTDLLVTRYHSLAVQLCNSNSQSPVLQPTAVSPQDGVLMAMRHVKNPHFGVQFHPESIGTVHGKQLLHNFCNICDNHKRKRTTPSRTRSTPTSTRRSDQLVSVLGRDDADSALDNTASDADAVVLQQSPFTVYITKVPPTCTMRPDQVMQSFLAPHKETHAFWLDEALADGKTAAVSILGGCNSGSGQRIEYWGPEKPVDCQGLFQWNATCTSRKLDTDILTYLQNQHLHATDAVTMVDFNDDSNNGNVRLNRLLEDELQDVLPFDYRGGHVGYLGYEVRHDTSRYLQEQEHGHHNSREINTDTDKVNGNGNGNVSNLSTSTSTSSSQSNPKIPTAAFMWADRSFVYDHQGGEWYLVGVAPTDGSPDNTMDWLRSTAKAMQEWTGVNGVNGSTSNANNKEETPADAPVSVPTFTPNRPRETYNRNFDECLEQIRLGESYELCLTNQLEANVRVPGSSPLELYSVLRRRNPAPFSAFLNWNGHGQSTTPTCSELETDAAVALCCSSPERFVSVKRKRVQLNNGATQDGTQDGTASYKLEVEAKPIKGTCARVIPANGKTRTASEQAEDVERAQTLQSSLKNRAENLMIVDLLRNDLSRVCETGSVHVAKLMDIESYATVHQMVSTIRGTLDPSEVCSIDVLKACFPGGSMTGAPKLRTMELLDAMEEGVSRGPYSGCLGYISLNGSMDMNIVIRTAVLTPADECDAWKVSIGAGGAITALSESTDEYEEMMLKSSAVVGAVQEWACPPDSTAENTTKHTFDAKTAMEGQLLDTKRV